MSDDELTFTEQVAKANEANRGEPFYGEQTAMKAVTEGVKEGVGAIMEGWGKAFDIVQSSPVLNDMANHGRSELAAALFGGQANAYVMYQHGNDQLDFLPETPSPEVQEPEIAGHEQSRGRSM